MGVCNCSMFCCTLLYVHSSIAIILMGKRELIALLNLSSWCLVMVERLFLAVPRGCLQFVIVVFPDYTHLLFFLLANYNLLPSCRAYLELQAQRANYQAFISVSECDYVLKGMAGELMWMNHHRLLVDWSLKLYHMN